MRSTRSLMVIGICCLLVAASSIAVGFTDPPWLTLIAAVLGSIPLVAALVKARGETSLPADHNPARGERIVRGATFGLAGLGLPAGVVALVVAEGEARGHAFALGAVPRGVITGVAVLIARMTGRGGRVRT